MLRGFAVGLSVGILGALVWILDALGHDGAAALRTALWPRSDGSDPDRGHIWDHGA